jgi:YD repeat-containing protein
MNKLFGIIGTITILALIASCSKKDSITPPALSTATISNISSATASSGGNVSDDGGTPVLQRGVCWGTTSSPTINLMTKTSDGTGIGSFTSQIFGLKESTLYHVRAYATNSAGTAYGSDITFSTTIKMFIPTLSTTVATSVSQTNATCGGNVTADGGAIVLSRGVCWSTAHDPTIADNKTSDGTGNGTFISSITSLTAATLYYARAYATNNIGTAYGNEITIKTQPNSPTKPAYKTTLQYNGNGYKISETIYKWDTNTTSWINYSKIEYTYDIQGHKTQSISSSWNTSTANWIAGFKDTFTYYAFGVMWPSIHYQWDNTSAKWLEVYKWDDYSDNTPNRYLFTTRYNWDTYYFQWVEYNQYRVDLTLDVSGRISQQIYNAYSADQYGFYGGKSRSIFTYDAKGNIINTKSQGWDSTYGWTDDGLLVTITYDNNGNPNEKLTSVWNTPFDDFIPSSKIIYTYDSSGNLVEFIEYSV